MNPIDPNAAGPASGGQLLQQESYAGQSQPKRRGWAAQPLDSSGCPPGAERAEWLEADGLGGFASGTVSGIRTRRYHALLLTATKPPSGRLVLVNGFDASVETASGTYALSSQVYPQHIMHPDGAKRIVEFKNEPWPKWIFALEDGTKIEQEIFAANGVSIVALSLRTLNATAKATLSIKPFLSRRD